MQTRPPYTPIRSHATAADPLPQPSRPRRTRLGRLPDLLCPLAEPLERRTLLSTAPEIAWVHQFGSSADDYVHAIDSNGNIYLAGYTEGSLVPGQPNAGYDDVFVRKIDAQGNFLWTWQFGTARIDYAMGIAADASGVYVAGATEGTLPGQSSAGGSDAFVIKLDAAGTHQWSRQFGTASEDLGYAIAADASGVFVTGVTDGSLAGQTNSGGLDAYLTRFDADGTQQWIRQFGTAGTDQPPGISADATGLYVAGYTTGTFPGQTSAGGSDAFVARFDAAGNRQWTQQFGTTNSDSGASVSADASGVYVGGHTNGTFAGQSSAGGFDGFIAKFDAAGTRQWTRQFGTAGADGAVGVASDVTGLYVAGYTEGTLPGQSSAGGLDAFVMMLDADGDQQWSRQFGTQDSDAAWDVSAGASGLYVSGVTSGTLPGQSSAGRQDGFVIKFGTTPAWASIVDGVLTLTDTENSDVFVLSSDAAHCTVKFGAESIQFEMSQVTGLKLIARGGDDVLTLDMSGGNLSFSTLAIEAAAGGGEDEVRLTHGDGRLLTLASVPHLNGQRLDLGTADLRITGVSVADVEPLLKTARDAAVRWSGPGIGTSAAIPNSGLGPVQQGPDLLVKYTYDGDANGDGRINADDYFRVDSGFLDQPANPLYGQGDFNFDDRIDADDYFLIDSAFLGQGQPLSGPTSSDAGSSSLTLEQRPRNSPRHGPQSQPPTHRHRRQVRPIRRGR